MTDGAAAAAAAASSSPLASNPRSSGIGSPELHTASLPTHSQQSPGGRLPAVVTQKVLREELSRLRNDLVMEFKKEVLLSAQRSARGSSKSCNKHEAESDPKLTPWPVHTPARKTLHREDTMSTSHSVVLTSCDEDIAAADLLLRPTHHQWASRHFRSHLARMEMIEDQRQRRSTPEAAASNAQQHMAATPSMGAVPSLSHGGVLLGRLSHRARSSPDKQDKQDDMKTDSMPFRRLKIHPDSAEITRTPGGDTNLVQPVSPTESSDSGGSSKDGSEKRKCSQLDRLATKDVNALDYSMGFVNSAAHAALLLPGDASPARRRLDRLINGPGFEMATLVLISLNAMMIGLETNLLASLAEGGMSDGAALAFRVSELFFCIAFSLELLLRGYTYRRRFFNMVGWAWNIFDLVVVLLQIIEEFFLLALDEKPGNHSAMILRVARMLRAVKIMRVFRMVRFARDLRLLVCCIVSSGKAFLWVCVLLMMMTYVMGVYIVQVIEESRPVLPDDEYEKLQEWFGSVPRAMLSLFEALTGGVDWDDLCRPLMTSITPAFGYCFTFWMAFSVLAVLNIVTGTFVEAAIERATEVKLIDRVHQARRLFHSLDLDRNGAVNFHEVVKQLNSIDKTELHEYFESIDVDFSEASCLFEILDIDDSGAIDLEEFISGCLRMQGPAKALDLLLITRESSRSMARQEKALTKLQALIAHLREDVDGMTCKQQQQQAKASAA
eukprot:TRINITY_DN11578_c0_g1_i1.p1 TRINITY_DN11578_c0_g1~~TRINITY_DN11578_c0_g1_i1.p1  ORF type:complete len:724 (+),score=158.66 TRINITY_DN11578_c0_g1_i1:87-2258(+)